MTLRRRQLNRFLMIIYFLCFIINIFFISSSFFSSIYTYLCSMLLLILGISNREILLKQSVSVIVIILILFFSFITLFIASGGLGSILNLLNFLFGVFIFITIEYDIFVMKFIYIICFIIYIYCLVLSFTIWDKYIESSNLMNPNTVGIVLLTMSMILHNVVKRSKILVILLFIITVYSIKMSNCRSALFGIIIYFSLYYFPTLKKTVLKYKKIILIVLVAIGVLFPIIYLYMYRNNVELTLPYTTKSLYTGREDLWDYMFQAFETAQFSYLFGVGSNYNTIAGIINNFHNWYIGIIYSFGIPSFLLYFILLISQIIKIKTQ